VPNHRSHRVTHGLRLLGLGCRGNWLGLRRRHLVPKWRLVLWLLGWVGAGNHKKEPAGRGARPSGLAAAGHAS
jgi:hypothetical protein